MFRRNIGKDFIMETENNFRLTEKEISEINRLMRKKATISLQPRKEGYIILETKSTVVYRSKETQTT